MGVQWTTLHYLVHWTPRQEILLAQIFQSYWSRSFSCSSSSKKPASAASTKNWVCTEGVGWDTPGSIKPMNDQNIPKGSCFSPFPTRVTLFSRFCYKRSRHADKARSPHVATQCQAQLQVQLRSGHWAAWVPRGEPARRGSQPQAAEIRSR